MINSTLQKLTGDSEFKKNLITLTSGVAIAQAIPILCSPILTRLFTPDDFGLYANFLAIVAFLIIVITGKYEMAIILPKKDKEAINVLSLSCFLAIFFSILFFLIFLAFGNPIARLLNVNRLSPYMWMIPVCALLSVVYLIFNEWCIRKKWFVPLGKNRISNTGGIAGASILFGLTKLQPGLIMGEILGRIFSVVSAIIRVFKRDRHLFAYVTAQKMRYFAKRYLDFAKFTIPAQLLNTLGGQLPVLVISTQFGLYETGLYMMGGRVLEIPMSFFGRSVGDVFKQRAAQDYQTHGNCIDIFKKTIFSLTKIAIIPFIIFFVAAPYLFAFVFGDEWYVAGIYARYLSIMYMLSFISMSVASIIIIMEKQRLELIWQILYVVCTALPLLVGGIFLRNIITTLLLLCVGRSIAYLACIFISYKLAKGKSK